MGKTVLAISGSLRNPSFTERMLDLCVEGMGEGFDVHKFHPHKMNIHPCTSCWNCWNPKTAGQCTFKDDMNEIIEVYKQADFFLLAAPLYAFGFPSTVKAILDRFFVTLEPTMVETSRGRTAHPKRLGRHPRTALISSCAYPESQNFDALRLHFKALVDHNDWTWAGELLIPGSGAAGIPGVFDKKLELVRRGGGELVKGMISPTTTEELLKPVMSNELYRKVCSVKFGGNVSSANASDRRG